MDIDALKRIPSLITAAELTSLTEDLEKLKGKIKTSEYNDLYNDIRSLYKYITEETTKRTEVTKPGNYCIRCPASF